MKFFRLVILLFVVLVSQVAFARGRPLVLVASDHPDVRMTRLESELIAAGLETRRFLAPPGARLGPDTLRRQADDTGVAAVLTTVDGGIEVWLRSKQDQGLVFVELVRENEGDLVPVRAVEIVRAALLGDETPPPDEKARPEPPAPLPAPSFSPHFTAFAGGAGLSAPGIGVTWDVNLILTLVAWPNVRFEVNAHIPVFPVDVERHEGSAKVRISTLGGSVAYVGFSPATRIRPHVRAGLSAVFLSANGSAFPPFFGNSGALAAPFVWLGTGASVRLGSSSHARGDIALGTTTAPMHLDFAGKNLATWGQPALIASLGLEFDFGVWKKDPPNESRIAGSL